MARAVLIVALLCAGIAPLTASCGRAPSERMNIVLLVADDMDYEHFGFLGHPAARTPALDRLAGQGAVFTHCFVPMSRCRPAQASLMSGQWPHQNGVYFNVGSDHIDPATSLAKRLKDAGFATIGEGKFWEYDPRLMGFSNYTIRNYETFVRLGQDHLFDWIDEHAGREPMFIWWAPELPHVPHDPPERLLQSIDPAAIPIPAWFKGDAEEYRERERSSLAMVAWLDEGIDALCAKLREKGVYEDTLFCFLIDNGWANGLVSKGSAFDKGLRTPVIFAWSKGIGADGPFADLVSPVDLHATLLDYAGVDIPPDCEGRSLRPRIEGRSPYVPREALYGALYPQTPLEDDADATRDAFALWARSEQWKYVYYLKDVREADDELLKIQANLASYPERARGDEELYDLRADPYELENLAARPEHAATKSRLRDETLAWWTATGGGALQLP